MKNKFFFDYVKDGIRNVHGLILIRITKFFKINAQYISIMLLSTKVYILDFKGVRTSGMQTR